MDAMLPAVQAAAGWTDFGVAAAGASAALAGLTIVTISVNVRQILASPALVPRSAVTIAGFVASLLASLALLLPQWPMATGIEVLVVTACAVSIEARAAWADVRQQPAPPAGYIVAHAALAAAWILPFAVAGVLLVTAATIPGLFVLAFGIAAAVVASIVNTWVLLIEILR
ncbi:MAG TPA: hypothetical protein VGM70_11405 [Pseudolysinimonas sp.]|jgi:modulator of FtsH protease